MQKRKTKEKEKKNNKNKEEHRKRETIRSQLAEVGKKATDSSAQVCSSWHLHRQDTHSEKYGFDDDGT